VKLEQEVHATQGGRRGGRLRVVTEAILEKACVMLRSGEYASRAQIARELKVNPRTLQIALLREAPSLRPGSRGRSRALTAKNLEKGHELLRSGDYTKREVCAELKIHESTLRRALSRETIAPR
jgi:DNA-binding CsgD family transcriptional regulator